MAHPHNTRRRLKSLGATNSQTNHRNLKQRLAQKCSLRSVMGKECSNESKSCLPSCLQARLFTLMTQLICMLVGDNNNWTYNCKFIIPLLVYFKPYAQYPLTVTKRLKRLFKNLRMQTFFLIQPQFVQYVLPRMPISPNTRGMTFYSPCYSSMPTYVDRTPLDTWNIFFVSILFC